MNPSQSFTSPTSSPKQYTLPPPQKSDFDDSNPIISPSAPVRKSVEYRATPQSAKTIDLSAEVSPPPYYNDLSQDKEEDSRIPKASKIQIGTLRQKISSLKQDKKFIDDRNALKSSHNKLMQSAEQEKSKNVLAMSPQKAMDRSPQSNKSGHLPIFIQAYTPKTQKSSPDTDSNIRSHSQQQPTINPPLPTQISNPPTLPNSNNSTIHRFSPESTPLTQQIKQSNSRKTISPAGTANSLQSANQLLLSFALSATTINSNNTNNNNNNNMNLSNYNSNNSQQIVNQSPFQLQSQYGSNIQTNNNILSSSSPFQNNEAIPRNLSRFQEQYNNNINNINSDNQFYQNRSSLINPHNPNQQDIIMSQNNILQFNHQCLTISQQSQQRTQTGGAFLTTLQNDEKQTIQQEQKISSSRFTPNSLQDAASLTQRVYSKKLQAKQLAESDHGAVSQDGSVSYIASHSRFPSSHHNDTTTNQSGNVTSKNNTYNDSNHNHNYNNTCTFTCSNNNNNNNNTNQNGSDNESRANFAIESVICSPKDKSYSDDDDDDDSQSKKNKQSLFVQDGGGDSGRKKIKRNMSLDDGIQQQGKQCRAKHHQVMVLKRESVNMLDKSRNVSLCNNSNNNNSSNTYGSNNNNNRDMIMMMNDFDNMYRSVGKLESKCEKKFEFELSSEEDQSPRVDRKQKSRGSEKQRKSQYKIENFISDQQINSDQIDLTLTPFLVVDCSEFDSLENQKQEDDVQSNGVGGSQNNKGKMFSFTQKSNKVQEEEVTPNCILSDSVFKSNSSQDLKFINMEESPEYQKFVSQDNDKPRNSRRDTLITLGPQGHCFVAAGNNNSGRTISPNQSVKQLSSYNLPSSILMFKSDDNNNSEYAPRISEQQDIGRESTQKLPQFKKCTEETLYLGNDEYQYSKQKQKKQGVDDKKVKNKFKEPNIYSSPSSASQSSESKSKCKRDRNKETTYLQNISSIEQESKQGNNNSEWQPITLITDQSNNTKFSFSRSPLFQALQTPSPLSKYPNPLNITEYPPSSKSGGGYDIVEYLINQGTPPGKKVRKKGEIPPTVPQKVAKFEENFKSDDSTPTPQHLNNITAQNQSISGFSGVNHGISNDNAIESGLYTFTNTFGISFSNSKISEKKEKEVITQIESQNLKSQVNSQLAQLKQNLHQISKNKNQTGRHQNYDSGFVHLGMRCSSAPPSLYCKQQQQSQPIFRLKTPQFDFKTKVISQMKKYILFLKQQLQASRLFHYTASKNNKSMHHRRLSSFQNLYSHNHQPPYVSNTTFHSKHSEELPIQLTPPPNKPNELNGRITAIHTAQQDHCQEVFENPSSLIYASTFVNKQSENQTSQNSSHILQASKLLKPLKDSPPPLLLIPTPTTQKINRFKAFQQVGEDNNKSLASTILHASASTPKLLTTSEVMNLQKQNPFTDQKSRGSNELSAQNSQKNQGILNNTINFEKGRCRSASSPIVNSGNLKIHLQNLKYRITQIKKQRDSFQRILTRTKNDLNYEKECRQQQKRRDQTKRNQLSDKLKQLTNQLKLSMEAQQELSRELRHHQTRPPAFPTKNHQASSNFMSDNEYKKVMQMVHQLDNRCAEQQIKISSLLQQMRQAEQDAERARNDHCLLFQQHDRTMKQMKKLQSEKQVIQNKLFEKQQDFISMRSALDIEQRLKVRKQTKFCYSNYQNMVPDQRSETASLSFSTSAKKVSSSNGPQPRQKNTCTKSSKQHHKRGNSNVSSKNVEAMIMQINSHPDSFSKKKKKRCIVNKSGGSSSSFVDQECKQKSVKRVLNLDDEVNPTSERTSSSQMINDKLKKKKKKKQRYFDDDQDFEQEQEIEQFRFNDDGELFTQQYHAPQSPQEQNQQILKRHKPQDSLSQQVALYLSSQQQQQEQVKQQVQAGNKQVLSKQNKIFGQQIFPKDPFDALSGRSSQICRQQSSDIFQLSTSQKKKLNLIASYGGGSSLLGSGNKIQSGGGTIVGSALASLRVSQTTINCQTEKKLDVQNKIQQEIVQTEQEPIVVEKILEKQPSYIEQQSKQIYALEFNDGGPDTTRGSPHSRQIIKQLNFDETPQQRSLLSTSNLNNSNLATKFDNSMNQQNNIDTEFCLDVSSGNMTQKKLSQNNNINPLLQIQDDQQLVPTTTKVKVMKQDEQQAIVSNNYFVDPIQLPKSLNSTMQYKSELVSVVDDDQKKEVEELLVATDGKNNSSQLQQQLSDSIKEQKDVLPNFCQEVNALLAKQQQENEQVKEDTADIARIFNQNTSRPISKTEGNTIPIDEYKEISQKFHKAEYQRGKLIKVLQMLGINQDNNEQINKLIELKQNDTKIQKTKEDMRKKYTSLKRQMIKQAKRWQMVSERQDKIQKRENKLNDRQKSCIQREGLLQMRIVCVKEMEQLIAAKNAKSQLIKEKKLLKKGRQSVKMSKQKQQIRRDKANSCHMNSIKTLSSPYSNADLMKSRKSHYFRDYQETLPNYYEGEQFQLADDINFRIASDQTIHNNNSPLPSHAYNKKSNSNILLQSETNFSKFQSSSSLNQFFTLQKQNQKGDDYASVSPIKEEVGLSRHIKPNSIHYQENQKMLKHQNANKNQQTPQYLSTNYHPQNAKRTTLNKAQQHSRNAQLVRAQTTKSLLQVNSKQVQRNFNLFKNNRKPQRSLINSAIVSQQHKNSINNNSPQYTSYQQDRPTSSATATFPQSLATFGTTKTLRALGAGSTDNIKSNIMTQKAKKKSHKFQLEDEEQNKKFRVPSYSQRDIGLINAVSNSNTIANSNSIPSSSNQSPFRLFQQKFNSQNSNRSTQFKQYQNQTHLQQQQQHKLRKIKDDGIKSNVGSRDQSSLFISDGQFNTNRCEMSASSFGNFQIQQQQQQQQQQPNLNQKKRNIIYSQQQYNSVNEVQTPNSFTSPNGFSTISPINAHSNQNSQNHQISASDQIYTTCFDQKNRSGELRQSNNNIFDANNRNSFNPSILYSSMPSSQTKIKNRTNRQQKEEDFYEDYEEDDYLESNRRNNTTKLARKQNYQQRDTLQMSPVLAMLANTQSTIQQSNSLGNSNPSSFLFQQHQSQQNQKFNQRQSLSGLGITSTTMIGANQSENNGGCTERESEYQLNEEEEEQDIDGVEQNKITDDGQNIRDDDQDDDDDDDDDEEDLDQLQPQSKKIIQDVDDDDEDDYQDDDDVSEQIRFVLKDDLIMGSSSNKNFYNDNIALYKSDGFLMRAKQQDSRNQI